MWTKFKGETTAGERAHDLYLAKMRSGAGPRMLE